MDSIHKNAVIILYHLSGRIRFLAIVTLTDTSPLKAIPILDTGRIYYYLASRNQYK